MSQAVVSLSPRDRGVLHDAVAPRVASVAVVLPEHRYEQGKLVAELQRRPAEEARAIARLARHHESAQVESRCLALPLEDYAELDTLGKASDAFIREGTRLGARAILGALLRANVQPSEVDALFFTTLTGLAMPSIDARLVNELGFKKEVRRTSIFGLGCMGGAATLARANDYLRGRPEHVVVALSVELCSLTVQSEVSVPNLVATGLFGDGAAAAVIQGAERASTVREGAARERGGASPRIVESRSVLFPNTERAMGWDVGDSGLRALLSGDVPDIVRQHLPGAVDDFLLDHGLGRRDVSRWLCHPGGSKVLSAIEASLDLPAEALAVTRRSLAQVGDLSSASVLHVLEQSLGETGPGDVGLLLAIGPGLSAEMVLLSW